MIKLKKLMIKSSRGVKCQKKNAFETTLNYLESIIISSLLVYISLPDNGKKIYVNLFLIFSSFSCIVLIWRMFLYWYNSDYSLLYVKLYGRKMFYIIIIFFIINIGVWFNFTNIYTVFIFHVLLLFSYDIWDDSVRLRVVLTYQQPILTVLETFDLITEGEKLTILADISKDDKSGKKRKVYFYLKKYQIKITPDEFKNVLYMHYAARLISDPEKLDPPNLGAKTG